MFERNASMATGRIAPSLLLLLLAGNAWASGIMASVSFDENGRALTISSETQKIPVVMKGEAAGTSISSEEYARWLQEKREVAGTIVGPEPTGNMNNIDPFKPKKEPAVEWCKRFEAWDFSMVEFCGMSDGSVRWKAK
jgi:hypothetical protein